MGEYRLKTQSTSTLTKSTGNGAGDIDSLSSKKQSGALQAYKQKNQPLPAKLKVKNDELMVFFRQLAVILQTGVPLSQGLDLLSENISNPKFAHAVSQISTRINAGQDLSSSLGAYPKVFAPITIGLIRAGEFGGILDAVIDRIANLIEQQAKLKGMIIGAMIYPGIVLFIALGVGLGMLIGIVPRFADMFTDLGADLPLITKVMLALSKAVTNPTIMLGSAGVIAATIVVFNMYYKTPSGRLSIDTAVLKIPLFGPLLLKYEVASFCETMSTLANAAIPVVEGMNITQQALNNTLIRQTIIFAIGRAEQGEPISQAILSRGTMPRLVPAMMKIGEETGEFAFMLEKLALFYSREIEMAVNKLAKAMEPAVVLVVAGIVGTIVVALYLPMFEMIRAFKQ